MKIIFALSLVLALSGCATVKNLWPTPHDPALAQGWVQVSLELQRVKCADRTDWSELIRSTEYVRAYADFRTDNQRQTAAGLQDNVRKAHAASNQRVCEHNLSLAKTRLEVLKTAWSGR